jgi:hypothetical protein
MKATDEKKLQKALELIKKADELIQQVKKSNDSFRYSSNINILDNSLTQVIDVLKDEI